MDVGMKSIHVFADDLPLMVHYVFTNARMHKCNLVFDSHQLVWDMLSKTFYVSLKMYNPKY